MSRLQGVDSWETKSGNHIHKEFRHLFPTYMPKVSLISREIISGHWKNYENLGT